MRFFRVLPFLCLVLCSPLALSASSKPQEPTQDGVLVSFVDAPSGASCSGGVYAANCQTINERRYTVRVSGQQLILVHVLSKADRRREIGVGLWRLPPDQRSVLASQLPGAHFQTWSDKEGVHIVLGGKQSLFQIVGASGGAADGAGNPSQPNP